MANARVEVKQNFAFEPINLVSIFHEYFTKNSVLQLPPQFPEFLKHISETFILSWDFGSISAEQSANLIAGHVFKFPLLRPLFDQNRVQFVRTLLNILNSNETIHFLVDKTSASNAKCNGVSSEIQERLKTLDDKLNQQQNAMRIANNPVELSNLNFEPERLKLFLNDVNNDISRICALITAPDGLAAQWRQHVEHTTALLSLVTNAILDAVREWREQQRMDANRTETRDDKGQQLAVPAYLEARLNRLEQLACAHVQQLYFLLDSLQRLTATTPNLLVQIQPLVSTSALVQQRVVQLLQLLATRTFLMYNHPAQVLKKENRFCASVRWLVGSALRLGPADFSAQYTARLLSREDTERLIADAGHQVRAGPKSARITQNAQAQMEKNESSDCKCIVRFTQMKYYKARSANQSHLKLPKIRNILPSHKSLSV